MSCSPYDKDFVLQADRFWRKKAALDTGANVLRNPLNERW